MNCWNLVITTIGAIATVIGVFVSIIIFKHIPDKDILTHRQRIRAIIKDLKREMNEGKRNQMLRIIDIDRFDKYYPEVFDNHSVQSCTKGELEGTDIKGIWIVDRLIGVKEKGGVFYPSNEDGYKTAKRLGLIPYSWIVDIDTEGDEIESSVIIYTKYGKHYPLSFKKYYRFGSDGIPVMKHGFVKKRSPFQQYEYFLLKENTKAFKQEIIVKGDNPVYP